MSSTSSLFFPPFQLDVSNEQLWREDETIPLRRKTLAVLCHLAEHPGQLVTKEQLLDAVWAGTSVVDTMPTLCIRELRKALGDDAKSPRFIETVHGRGYRFIAAVTAAPVPSSKFQVSSSTTQDSPLRTQHSVLVGREAELTQLHHLLEQALRGERQLVFVTGEPGIGKTTVVEAFLTQVGARVWGRGTQDQRRQQAKIENPSPAPDTRHPAPPLWMGRGQCIEQHGAGEAFLPILDALGRLCRGAHGAAMISLLRRYAPMWLVQMPSLLEPPEYETLQRQVQGASRERMLREMTEALERLTADQPLILVLEDLHWSDVSTLDLLAFIARRKESARLLVIGAYRPVEMLRDRHPLKDMTQELYGHRLATELALGLLSEEAIGQYLEERLGVRAQHAAPLQTLARMLHHRTDGNPLFLVSLVNYLIERQVFGQSATGWKLPENAVAIESTVPDTIRHLVARQSGRLLSEERQTLQAASVAGMEFSSATVAAALATDTAAIEQRCEQLAERQQFLKRLGVEEWPDGTLAARYSFLHALYQQLWHEHVSPTQIQHFHLQIGQRKERAYGERAREIAAELAVHFEQGRNYRKAVQYLQYAGTNALQRSAYQEAITLLTKGLELLTMLPAIPERAQQEIILQTTLGAPLIATKGYAAPEVGQTYARARELCQELGEPSQIFAVLWGLWAFSQVRADLATTRAVGKQLFQLAHRHHSAEGLVGAHLALGEALFLLGEFSSAREHLEQCLALYDPQQHTVYIALYGLDPGIFCLSWLPHVLWHLGYPDQALTRCYELLKLARTLDHPFSLAFALDYASMFHQFRGDNETAYQLADAAILHCTEHGFALYLAWGKVIQGWARMARGERKDGMVQLRQGIADWQATGAALRLPYYLALLAEAQGKANQGEKGLSLLDAALAQGDKTQERHYEAELYRLKGELTLQKFQVSGSKVQVTNLQPPISNPQAEAEGCFLKAIDITRKQGAKSLELRATTSLARLWQQQGKKKQSHKLLAETYNWFTEGFDTRDLQEAKALLEELPWQKASSFKP